MTWYAYHLFAEASPHLLEEFLASPVMSKGVYWVLNLDNYSWHDPRVKHELPSNGLLVVRPIGDPASHFAEWYQTNIISWFEIQGEESIELSISPGKLQQDNPDYEVETYPPQAFLKYVKQLSIDHKSTLAFYHCSMWGGDTDLEYAWVFKKGHEVAYSGIDFRAHPNVIREYHHSGERIERKGDILMDTMSHFSMYLPTPFFALHTRGFPWESAKVVRPKLGAG